MANMRFLLTPLALAAVALFLTSATGAEDPPIEKAEKLLKSGLYEDRMHGLELVDGLESKKAALKLAIPALSDEDWGVQIRACDVVAKIGGDDALDALVEAAVNGEIAWVREAAVRGLAMAAPDEAAKLFLDRTKRTRDDAQKARAVRSASRLLGAENVRKLREYARDKDTYLSAEAARALALVARDPEARPDAMKVLMPILGKRAELKYFLSYAGIIEGLSEVDDLEIRMLLVNEVLLQKDDDNYVIERVARALGHVEPTEAAKAMRPAFKAAKKPGELRRLARLVARVGTSAVAEQTRELLAHEDERVRSEATRALGRILDREAATRIAALLEYDESWYVRAEAVSALAQLLEAAEFRKLREQIGKDESDRVRLRFVVELHDAVDPEGIHVLMPFLKDKSWRVSSAAAATIGALGIGDDMGRLVPLTTHKDWRLRAAAFEGLGRLRAAKAIPLLAAGLEDRDPVVKGVCWVNLQILTGEKFDPDADQWRAWYAENSQSINIVKRSRRSAEEIAKERQAAETNKRYGLEPEERIEILQKARILVLTGAWDKVQIVLKHLDIKHTLLRAQQLKNALLTPNQILLVNCEGNVDAETAVRIDWFVNVGGYLMTTDWALTKTVMPIFPGFVTQYARSSTGNDVVVVEEAITNHPLTAGVFENVPAMQWWLEIQAFPITVLYPERVDVIADSAQMRQRYGSSPMGLVFRSGLGKVQHSVSHFYLQEEGMQHASKPRDRMVFAADNLGLKLETIRKMALKGSFDGRLSEATMKEIAPDYSMFRLIVNFVAEKSDWVENL